MKKRNLLLILVMFGYSVSAQVGINTEDPKATLDVQSKPSSTVADGIIPPRLTGNELLGKEGSYKAPQNGTIVYVTTPRTTTTGAFKTLNVTSTGLYIFDANALNSNPALPADPGLWAKIETSGNEAYYATKTGGWSLLNLALGSGWQGVALTGTADTKLGDPALLTNGVYTAPSSGTYSVSYEFQFSGVDLNLLGGKSLGLVKNGTTLWDSKNIDAVRVEILGITLASVPLTSTTLTSLVQLNNNDTLAFAVNTTGLLPIGLTLLTTAKVNIRIHKISN